MNVRLVNIDGMVIALLEDGTVIVVEDDPEHPPAFPIPPRNAPADADTRARPIVLGPRTRPPLPTSLQLVKTVGHGRRLWDRPPFVIRLDRDLELDHLRPDLSRGLERVFAPDTGNLSVDVYVPRNCTVGLNQLSGHITDLCRFAPVRSLHLRVGGEIDES